ncbi:MULTISPECIES: ATPase [unclassified Pseudomonas]|uniref:ATPase n=1 Tax=unclassified Pseudomonas TaxID=196821 RepID=UPI002AB4D9C9|nr:MULTISPECIES: ATPase [unclassified Pseudomonas]MDY7560909.1 ATPase [Pseudomonas sp. AB6]
MKIRIAALLALVVMLAGCATGAAQSSDNQDGVFRSATQASGLALKHTQSVGVVFSENTVTNLAYLERYHAVAQNSQQLDEEIQRAFVSSSDPALAIDWLKTSLQAQFASVNFYDNLDALMAARPDIIVLLDTSNVLVTPRSPDVQASIVAEFFDAQLNYIGKAEGHAGKNLSPVWALSKSAPEVAAEINGQRVVQVDALQQFDASLYTLLNARS